MSCDFCGDPNGGPMGKAPCRKCWQYPGMFSPGSKHMIAREEAKQKKQTLDGWV